MKQKTTFFLVLTFSMTVIVNHLFAQSGKSQGNADQTLELNRRKIDSLDKKLIEILGDRERAVRAIGIYKAKNNIPSLQAVRFQQVLDKGIEAGGKEGLSSEFITELLNAIHKESLRLEDDIMSSSKPQQ